MGTLANLLAGPGMLYVAPVGESLPELNDIDSGIITPAGNWSALGYRTEPGLLMEYNPGLEKVMIEEATGPVKMNLHEEEVLLSSGLAERDMQAYKDAISALTTSQTAAGASQTAQDVFSLGGGTVREVQLLFIGKSPEGYSRAIVAWKAVAQGKISDKYSKKFAGINAQWMVLSDPSKSAGQQLLKVIDITAVPTS